MNLDADSGLAPLGVRDGKKVPLFSGMLGKFGSAGTGRRINEVKMDDFVGLILFIEIVHIVLAHTNLLEVRFTPHFSLIVLAKVFTLTLQRQVHIMIQALLDIF